MTNRKTLVWFLNFINQDIKTLSHGDRLKWITEALYVIDGGKPYREFRALPRYEKSVSENKIREWENGHNLEESQSYIRNFLNELISNIERYIAERSEWKPLDKLKRKSTFSKIKTKGILRIQLPMTSGTVRKPRTTETKDEKSLYRINKKKMYEKKFRVIFDLQNDQESLLVAFCQNLERIPIGSLRKCPECSNWFLHLSKKVKTYCTNKCAARYGSRQRRQKLKMVNPDEYEFLLSKNAERARKSYEKRQRTINPNAKIARRPRKYKE